MIVRYTLPALDDLEKILAYIDQHSPQGARRVPSRLQSLIGLLEDHPLLGVRTDDPTIRRLVALPYPYLVFYEVAQDEVIVHHIRHASRDPQGLPGAP